MINPNTGAGPSAVRCGKAARLPRQEGEIEMTREKLQSACDRTRLEAIRLAEKANKMVKSSSRAIARDKELTKFQAGFYLREAVRDLIAIAKQVEQK